MNPRRSQPPKLARRLLQCFLKEELLEEVEGDLEERYTADLDRETGWRAQLGYWLQVLDYCRPFAVKNVQRMSYLLLVRNYFKVALRLFVKEKAFSMVNTLGLALGIACSFFIYLWVQDEVRYNRFLQSDGQVCAILNKETQTNGEIHTYPMTAYPLKAVLEEEYPVVEGVTVLSNGNWMAFRVGEDLIEWTGVDASPDVFSLFEIPFVKGAPDQMFESANALAISESMAETYFGKDWKQQDVVGTLMTNDEKESFQLAGVYQALPKHSTVQFDFVVPFANRLKKRKNLVSWDNSSNRMFVKLQGGVGLADANMLLENAINDHREGDFLTSREVLLQPFEDLYLHNMYENGAIAGGRIDYVRLLSVAALLLLVLPSINFMNLTTARATRRAKETGVRKVMGALRHQLSIQFLLESVLVTLVAVMVALLLVFLWFSQFEELTGKEYEVMISWWQGFLVIAFVVVQGTLSGFYPALFMASMKTIASLKAGNCLPPKHGGFRKALVVFQFVITLIIIVGAIAVYQQVAYIRTKNIGLDRANLLRTYSYDMDPTTDYPTYKAELLREPSIESVTIVNQLLIDMRNATSGVTWEGKPDKDELEFYHMDANPDFVPTMRLELMEGRNFDWRIQSDTNNYLINETAMRKMGIEDPVGKGLDMWGVKGKIIGVVKDFHHASLHSPIQPIILRNKMRYSWMVLVRYQPGMAEEAIASLQKIFEAYNPSRTFWCRFVDELYESQYKNELLIQQLSGYFTVISIVISLVGLFALVAYHTERRSKEVGIRKVLGASIAHIWALLSTEYVVLLTVAMLVAFPIGYLLMSRWLSGFAYRVALGWWWFALAGVAAFILALAIVALRTTRLATANPVRFLRDE